MTKAEFSVGDLPGQRNFVQTPPFRAKDGSLMCHDTTSLPWGNARSKFSDFPMNATVEGTTINRGRNSSSRELPLYPAVRRSFEDYDPDTVLASQRVVPRPSCTEHSSYQRFGKTYCTGEHHELNRRQTESTESDATQLRNDQLSSPDHGAWLDARALLLDPTFKFSSGLKIREMKGPGEVEILSCSSVVEYPAGEHNYVLHIVVPTLTNPLLVVNALRNSGYIRGRVERTPLETTFLLDLCKSGHYEIDLGVGKCSAHLLLYEPHHKGHRGCFAAGYSYFLCGFSGPSVQRVLVRANTQETLVVISRSYASDCESLTRPQGSPKFGVETLITPSEDMTWHGGYGWEQMIHQEETDLLKEFLDAETEPSVETIRQPALVPVVRRRALQMEQPLMSRESLLRALGVFFWDSGNRMDLKMRNFPCVRCDSDLLRESRSPIRRKSGPTAKLAATSTGTLKSCKYFAQRFRLVSRFNEELNLSDTAWFSICPEEISKHIARRIATLSLKLGRKIRIMDPFCGAGGNIIQAARMDEVSHAYASDIDDSEVQCAQRMAELYGVEEKLSFVVSDVFDLKPQFFDTIDCIVSSPPWGGPSYLEGAYDLASMDPSYNRILAHCAEFTRNMAFLLPRNICIDQVVQSAPAAHSTVAVELEVNMLAGKPKTSTVYYGGLVNQ